MIPAKIYMVDSKLYTSQLGAGLGLVNETKSLLDLYALGMSASQLNQAALQSGRFPNVTARRLRNIIMECFAPRYLIKGGEPAALLKQLASIISNADLMQLMLVYTSRANPILGDFIRQVYWARYRGGYQQLTNDDARTFVQRAIDDRLTTKRWSEPLVQNVSGYLTGCCADYGMLEGGRRTHRSILPFRISPLVAAYLAYELHFSGVGDHALLNHEDWQLFGLAREDVQEELKRLSLKGLIIIQAAGEVVRISWKQPTMEALCDALTQS
jgi:hypothetical protein